MTKLILATSAYSLQEHNDFGSFEKNIDRWVSAAKKRNAELVVFPEYGSHELVSLMSAEVQKSHLLQLKGLQNFHQNFISIFTQLAKKYELAIVAPSFPVEVLTRFVNKTYVFFPDGGCGYQEKKTLSKFERDILHLSLGEGELKVFEYNAIKFGINIGLDITIPEFARELCAKGVQLILSPASTGKLSGMNRVHVAARARALENKSYVAIAQSVGRVDYAGPVISNTGISAIYSPSLLDLPEDGILARSDLNKGGWLVSELDFSKLN